LDASGVRSTSLDATRVGMEQVVWPGRFEVVVRDGQTIVLDGAHNVDSAHQLRAALDERFGSVPRAYVLGIAADKDVPGIVAALAPAAEIVATRSTNPRATDPAHLAEIARAQGIFATEASDVAIALSHARGQHPGQLIVVTGSLYMVAEAREALGLAEPSHESDFNPWATR
jgi:dihydrofolate synthase / folylpolyglutamate synthase